jgi:UDP-N-acetylmuramate: L-alanyl-gamma-D-glutamyl-meso-diaminopimelate ligase
VEGLTPRLQQGDVVAILSNGGFDGIYEKLPNSLRQHPSKVVGEAQNLS